MRVRLPALALLALPVLAAACVWPGHMDPDTLQDIEEARSGEVSNVHAPVLLWLWHLAWPLGLRPGILLLLQTACFAGGAYLLMRVVLARAPAAATAAAVSLYPPILGWLVLVGRDAWLTALIVAAFGCCALAARSSGSRRTRALWAATGFAWLALAARLNAFTVVLVALVTVAWLARSPRWRESGTALRRRAAETAALAGALFALAAGSQALLWAAIDPVDLKPGTALTVFDLAAISIATGEHRFPPELGADPERVREGFRQNAVDVLLFAPDAAIPLREARPLSDELRSRWREAIRDEPGAYLEHRYRFFRRQVSIDGPAEAAYYFVIFPNDLGYDEHAFPGPRDAVDAWLRAPTLGSGPVPDQTFSGGRLHEVWLYLLACAGLAVVLLRRRDPGIRVAGALAASGLALQPGLFLLSMSAQYRYELPAVAAAVLSGVIAAVLGLRAVRTRVRVGGRWTPHRESGSSSRDIPRGAPSSTTT